MSLKEQIQDAKEAVVNVLKPSDNRATESDILDTLKNEHDEVRELLSNLQDSEDANERRGLVRQITAALVPHSVAEEKIVYEAVKGLSDTQAKIDGFEGALEHKWAAATVEKLNAIADASSPEHKATGKVLRELVEHHIKEEERNIWRDVRKHFSDEDRARMNAQYLAEKHNVPLPKPN